MQTMGAVAHEGTTTGSTSPGPAPFGRNASIIVTACIGLAVAVHLAAAFDRPYVTSMDVSIIELMVRRAARFQQSLGPYSRFGWSHPGPFWFYLLAPFESAFGPRGLFLGSWFVNFAAVLCTVWTVRRWAGEMAARWTVAVLVVLMASAPTTELFHPWNPSTLSLPIVLMAILAAATWAGSRLSLAGVAITASFLVQTHLGMLPLAGMTVIAAALGAIYGRRDAVETPRTRPSVGRHSRRSRAPWLFALTALVLIWLPPVSQQLTADGPGNFNRIATFFGDPVARNGTALPRPTAEQAIVAMTRSVGSFPLGRDPLVAFDDVPRDTGRVVVTIGWLVLAIAVAVLGRRHSRLATAMAIWTVAAFGVGFVAAFNVSGSMFSYLFWWYATLPVPAAIGAGILLASRLPQLRARRVDERGWSYRRVLSGLVAVTTGVGLVLLMGLSATLVVEVAQGPPEPWPAQTAGSDAAAILTERYADYLDDGVRVAPSGATHHVTSALVPVLDRRGFTVSVPDNQLYTFGERSRSTGREKITATITLPGLDPSAEIGPGATPVGPVGKRNEYVLWVATR